MHSLRSHKSRFAKTCDSQGDSFAHSRDSDGNQTMFGSKVEWLQYLVIDFTLEHAVEGGEEGDHADHIAHRPTVYKEYVQGLVSIMNNKNFSYNSKIKNSKPDLAVFKYTADKGTTKDQNIFLYSKVIDMNTGQSSFTFKDNDPNLNLFIDFLNTAGIVHSNTGGIETHSLDTGNATNTAYSISVTTITITKK